MQESILKKIWDFIISAIFYILCLLAFFMLVAYLPDELNKLFNTTVFKNAHALIFFVLMFIIGYMIYNNHNKEAEAGSNRSMERVKELSGTINLVNYLNNYDYKTLKVIQYAYYKGINDFHIIIKDTDIQVNNVFVKTDTLYNLDLKLLDECMQTYNDIIDPFKITMHIKNNYKGIGANPIV